MGLALDVVGGGHVHVEGVATVQERDGGRRGVPGVSQLHLVVQSVVGDVLAEGVTVEDLGRVPTRVESSNQVLAIGPVDEDLLRTIGRAEVLGTQVVQDARPSLLERKLRCHRLPPVGIELTWFQAGVFRAIQRLILGLVMATYMWARSRMERTSTTSTTQTCSASRPLTSATVMRRATPAFRRVGSPS